MRNVSISNSASTATIIIHNINMLLLPACLDIFFIASILLIGPILTSGTVLFRLSLKNSRSYFGALTVESPNTNSYLIAGSRYASKYLLS